jgi:two-component system LytT family response regulator
VTAVSLRALVVDDEKPARDLLASLLAEDPQVEVVARCQSGQEALDRLARETVDLVFLDIQMPGLDGLEVARRLPRDGRTRVVFVTAHDDFAVSAFEVHALDYLLKPFPRQRLLETLRRAKRQFATAAWKDQNLKLAGLLDGTGPAEAGGYIERFQVQTGTRLFAVPVARISRLESADHYTRLWADGVSHMVLRAISSLEDDLDPAQFVRIHRTRIVNVRHVRAVRSESGTYVVELTDGSRHAVSRSRRDVLSRLLPDA